MANTRRTSQVERVWARQAALSEAHARGEHTDHVEDCPRLPVRGRSLGHLEVRGTREEPQVLFTTMDETEVARLMCESGADRITWSAELEAGFGHLFSADDRDEILWVEGGRAGADDVVGMRCAYSTYESRLHPRGGWLVATYHA